MTPGLKHDTVVDFKAEVVAHGGDPDQIKHVCVDMSAAYTKRVSEALLQAQISYDRCQVIALANEAKYAVRRQEMQSQPRAALGNFVAIAYLRMSKLNPLPHNPSRSAFSRTNGITQYRSGRQVPYRTA